MSIPPDMAERHARVLARLTELGLALAERTFEAAEAAETPAERIEAVKAFHTISRSVRQSVALEAKLARQQAQDAVTDAGLAAREALLRAFKRPPEPYVQDDDDAAWDDRDEDDEDDAPEIAPAAPPLTPPDPAVLAREADLRTAARRLIWHERERLDVDETPDDLFALLEERLESRRRRPDFCKEVLDDQVLELCAALGVSTDRAADWRDVPDPEPTPDPEPPSVGPDLTDPWRSSA
jgi:hypothetical protein